MMYFAFSHISLYEMVIFLSWMISALLAIFVTWSVVSVWFLYRLFRDWSQDGKTILLLFGLFVSQDFSAQTFNGISEIQQQRNFESLFLFFGILGIAVGCIGSYPLYIEEKKIRARFKSKYTTQKSQKV